MLNPASFLDLSISIAFGLVTAALALTLWRLLFGPDKPDRILALDTLYVNAIALLVLVGIHLNSALYFEAALLIAMMGFVGTVAFCKYLLRGDIIE
ncbi:K+/H+ antiporter subunit F [Thiorhodococcus fuscus]|uniref:K+/H+ antiporter subunit F n=1 Tax=Thiorhodococcus fuscus TaxID=527200 RepID=A0ABW4Y999_9GAMM